MTRAPQDRVRVASNTRWFADDDPGATPRWVWIALEGDNPSTRALWRVWRHTDVVVLNVGARAVLAACALSLLPGRAPLLVAVDLILPRPRTWRGAVAARAKGLLLRRLHALVLYCRDTADLRAIYGLPRALVRFVPFKVNQPERTRATPVRDDGFALACGRSQRDYATLFEAACGLDVAVRVLAPEAPEAAEHGTDGRPRAVPPNVSWERDDGSFASFLEWIGRCAFLVLPVNPETLAPSGVSTYLSAMAMGKAVVITEGPATRGLLDDGQALVVPPRDPAALREAMARLATDAAFRQALATRGRAYADSLGDERRLARDVRGLVRELLAAPRDVAA
jgi:glycosyltransferase involved in cell wall biosynthesis